MNARVLVWRELRGCRALARLEPSTLRWYVCPEILPESSVTTTSDVPVYCLLAVEDDTVYLEVGSRLAAFDRSGRVFVLTEDALSGNATGAIQQVAPFEGRICYVAYPNLIIAFDGATLTATRLEPPLPPVTPNASNGELPSLKLDRARGHLSCVAERIDQETPANAIQRYDPRQLTFITAEAGSLLGGFRQRVSEPMSIGAGIHGSWVLGPHQLLQRLVRGRMQLLRRDTDAHSCPPAVVVLIAGGRGTANGAIGRQSVDAARASVLVERDSQGGSINRGNSHRPWKADGYGVIGVRSKAVVRRLGSHPLVFGIPGVIESLELVYLRLQRQRDGIGFRSIDTVACIVV